MNDTKAKNAITRNLGLWMAAALLYPVAHWIPTSSGSPPKIFEVLIPVIVLGLGWASTSFLRAAFDQGSRDPDR